MKNSMLKTTARARSLFTVCAAICAFGATSQSVVKEMDGANTRFIPGCYMKSGEAAIYFSEDEYGYSDGGTCYEAQIFDFDLNPLKSFYFQIFHPYTVTEARATSGVREKTRVIEDARNMISGLPPVSTMNDRKTSFINWVFESNRHLDPTITLEGLTSGCTVEGTTVYITMPATQYIGAYSEYLKSVRIYLDESDIFGYKFTYAMQVPVCDGEWTKSTWYDVPVSNFCTPRCNDVGKLNHWNGGVYLPFSQTFFNDDEKFEYVRYTAELAEGKSNPGTDVIAPDSQPDAAEFLFGITPTDRDGDGVEDFRQTYYGIHCTGIEVVSEDGDVIYSFPVPDNCEGKASIEFFKSDSHILAQADFNWYDDEKGHMHTVRFYRIDKNSGVAKIIREENHMSTRPNPVSAGTPVEISLPLQEKGPRTVTVTAMNGTKVLNRTVAPGTPSVSIPTGNLSPGIYLFTLTENGKPAETCRIIIR